MYNQQRRKLFWSSLIHVKMKGEQKMLKGQSTYNERKLIDFIPYKVAPDEIFVYVTDKEVPRVKPYYMVSNYGRVFMRYNQIPFMSPSLDTKGYWFVILQTYDGPKSVRIHRLVKLAFDYINNHSEFVVDHNDGNRRNPYIGNLEWITQEVNKQRGIDRCSMYHTAPPQMTPEYIAKDIENMSKLREEIRQKNAKQNEITDYNQKNFNDLKSNYNCQYTSTNTKIRTSHSDQEVHTICKMLQEGHTMSYIATTLHIKKNYVSAVYHGQARPDISRNYDFSKYGTIPYYDKWLFTPEQVRNICEYMSKYNIGEAPSKKSYIKRMFAILNIEYSDAKYGTVLDIYKGRGYTIISKDYDIRHENKPK